MMMMKPIEDDGFIKIFDEVMFLYLHLIESGKIHQIENYNPEIIISGLELC